MKRIVLMLACMVIAAGCTYISPNQRAFVSPAFHNLDHESYVVFPFDDFRTEKRDVGANVVQVMTDAFETAMLKMGNKVVERRKIDSVLKEMKFSYNGNVDETQLKEIGKMTNSHVLVLGMIRTFQNAEFNNKEKPDRPTKCTTISISAKAIHIQTGEILWKASTTKSTGLMDDFMCGCKYDVIKYADNVAVDLVKKIKKEIDAKAVSMETSMKK